MAASPNSAELAAPSVVVVQLVRGARICGVGFAVLPPKSQPPTPKRIFVDSESTRYFGKYRGTVFNNVDPQQLGRIQALVPDVLGDTPSGFAMPCLPLAGVQMGQYVVPVVGSGVWIEFEGGDPDSPIWAGCWYTSAAEVPAQALAGPADAPNIVLQSHGLNSIVLSDLDAGPGVTLKAASGAFITINDAGISIINGKGATITLAGPSVDINGGALVIT